MQDKSCLIEKVRALANEQTFYVCSRVATSTVHDLARELVRQNPNVSDSLIQRHIGEFEAYADLSLSWDLLTFLQESHMWPYIRSGYFDAAARLH